MSTVSPHRPVSRARRRAEQVSAAEAITAAFRAKLLERVERGDEITRLGDAAKVAEQLVARLPVTTNPWSDVIGPVYTSGSLSRELNISRQALSKAASDLRLLRLTTADGHTVYPAFQVVGGSLVAGLRDVLGVLNRGVDDPWTWAQWLNTPVSRRSPTGKTANHSAQRHIDRLIAGDVTGVIRAAERTAASWIS